MIGPDGQTTIIDGTSDVFKIAATGTLSCTASANSTNVTSVALTGLGAQVFTPAHLALLAVDNSSNSAQRTTGYLIWVTGEAWTYAFISGGIVNIALLVGNTDPSLSHTVYARFYVLFEVGM